MQFILTLRSVTMKVAVFLLQFVTILLLSKTYHCLSYNTVVDNSSSDLSCPPWTFPSNQSGEYQCECGDSLKGVVKCGYPTILEISVISCHCMTYSEIYNTTVVGFCIFYCQFLKYDHYNVYTTHVHDLNPLVCNHSYLQRDFYRTNQMCGSCQPGYAPPAYSYSMGCVECRDYKYNWLKYIGVAILPLTLLYIVIVLFRVSITTGTMNSYVLASQIIAAPVQYRLIAVSYSNPRILNIISSLYMIWNLDIFRSLYQPFCLHPKTNTLHTLALDYAIAVYPLLLVVLTYVAANLHEHYIVFVRLWRPFYRVFAWFRRGWNIRSSLIDAFGTFIVLSYVKILNASFDLLTPVALYDVHGNRMPQLYLYYDGTVEYFGKDHAPFAVLALFMFAVFNLLPLILLCLYPCRCFQRCLTHFKLHSHVLNTFMDTFQGCFRTQPYECRYFAGLYLGFRIISLTFFTLTTSPMYYPLVGIAASIMAVTVAIVRPYKSQKYVALDVIFFAMMSMIGFSIPAFAYTRRLDPGNVVAEWSVYGFYPLLLAPPIYGIGLLTFTLTPKRVVHNIKNYTVRHCNCNNHGGAEEEPLIYRLQLSDEYTPFVEDSTQTNAHHCGEDHSEELGTNPSYTVIDGTPTDSVLSDDAGKTAENDDEQAQKNESLQPIIESTDTIISNQLCTTNCGHSSATTADIVEMSIVTTQDVKINGNGSLSGDETMPTAM